ncbi:MAG: HD domain-containing protein, partial [Vulcanimicrobiaceae bacterium]
YVLTLDAMRDLQRTMLRLAPAERRKLPGMNPRRSDIIVAGNAIAIAALEILGRDELVVCDRALREGIVVDYLERDLAVARRVGDERTRRLDAVHEVARRFHAGGAHESHVAGLALDLFDRLGDVHGFEPADRDVLFAAAILHDVGRTVNPSAHHKHGAYLVRAAGIDGWRPEEVELIATLVRYHRRSLPKPTHPEFAVADAPTRRRILGLGALLRIADGLDRRRLGLAGTLAVTRRPGAVEITVDALQNIEPEIEGACYKADLFERAFGLPATIVAREIEPACADEDDESDSLEQRV